MKLRAVILLKNRQALIKKLNPKKDEFKHGEGLYIVGRKSINNWQQKDTIKGSEIYFFEGNPNPVRLSKTQKDESTDYLNDLILENALKQTSMSKPFNFEGLKEFIGNITDPKTFLMLLLIAVILYGVIWGGIL